MTPEELKKQTASLYVARLVEHDLPGITAEEQGSVPELVEALEVLSPEARIAPRAQLRDKAWEEYLEESRKQRRYGRLTPKPTQATRVKVSH